MRYETILVGYKLYIGEKMDYIKIDDTDPKTSCYHFSKIANRESIKRLGLKSVAGRRKCYNGRS